MYLVISGREGMLIIHPQNIQTLDKKTSEGEKEQAVWK